MTSLPAADCSRSLLLQSGTRGRRWFDGVSVVQPVPMSMMTVGVVDLEVQQLAADRRSCRPARVHGDTDIPTRHAYTRFAAVHAANGVVGTCLNALPSTKRAMMIHWDVKMTLFEADT